MTKELCRKKYLMLRKQMDFHDIANASKKIRQTITEMEIFNHASTIYGYMPFKNEVDVVFLEETSKMLLGKPYMIPKVTGKEMKFYELESYDKLAIGTYGIMEPRGDEKTREPDGASIVLVPGVCFDEQGYRIGYGGGYYDRLMKKYPEATYIGVCFDEQLIPEIPREPHDRQLHWIITDKRTLSF